jgi:hypothetical protein
MAVILLIIMAATIVIPLMQIKQPARKAQKQ